MTPQRLNVAVAIFIIQRFPSCDDAKKTGVIVLEGGGACQTLDSFSVQVEDLFKQGELDGSRSREGCGNGSLWNSRKLMFAICLFKKL